MPVLLLMLLLAACSGDDDPAADDRENPNEENETQMTFAEQAEQGADLYAANCSECHGAEGQGTDKAPRLVGLDEGALPLDPPESRMLRTEQFVTVADVASFVVMNMPPNAAGSLSNSEYLAILAFDLQANGITLEEPLDLDLAETLTIPR